MVVPRHIVPATLLAVPLLALAMAPAAATSATSKAKAKSTRNYVMPCLKDDGITVQYSAKPRRCVTSELMTQERSLVLVTSIKWSTWTASRGKGVGKVDGDGYKGKVVVTATKPKRCSARRVIFTRVTVAIRLDDGLGTVGAVDATCPE
ncbi:MAG: hypothetical protein J7513_05890 [Solirubrobacteraceae bacterium]|nr:hypothetical protein [Solirubrobacteraceae bacterium]